MRLKNFTVIPKHNELDSVLLIEIIPDFTRVGVFRTNQDQVTREHLMMTAVIVLSADRTASSTIGHEVFI